MPERTLVFPIDTSMGCIHARESAYPYEFHGRFKKEGRPLEETENPGWHLVGDACGPVTVNESGAILLEVEPATGKDLSCLGSLAPDALRAIWLGNTDVSDSELHHLSPLTDLEWIDIQNNGSITGVSRTRDGRR